MTIFACFVKRKKMKIWRKLLASWHCPFVTYHLAAGESNFPKTEELNIGCLLAAERQSQKLVGQILGRHKTRPPGDEGGIATKEWQEWLEQFLVPNDDGCLCSLITRVQENVQPGKGQGRRSLCAGWREGICASHRRQSLVQVAGVLAADDTR